jgi:hypothetical protein
MRTKKGKMCKEIAGSKMNYDRFLARLSQIADVFYVYQKTAFHMVLVCARQCDELVHHVPSHWRK